MRVFGIGAFCPPSILLILQQVANFGEELFFGARCRRCCLCCCGFCFFLLAHVLHEAEEFLHQEEYGESDNQEVQNFTDEGAVTSLVAGTPYIVKWTSGTNLENPVFTGVTIDKTSRDVICDLGNGQLVTFKGTYGYTVFTNVDKSILFVGANNKLHYPLSGASIGAQRSYFQLDGVETSLNPSQNGVKAFVMNFGDEATGIFEYSENSEPSDSWYDISGRKIVNGKLSNRKLPKGIYVNKGHKVIIK